MKYKYYFPRCLLLKTSDHLKHNGVNEWFSCKETCKGAKFLFNQVWDFQTRCKTCINCWDKIRNKQYFIGVHINNWPFYTLINLTSVRDPVDEKFAECESCSITDHSFPITSNSQIKLDHSNFHPASFHRSHQIRVMWAHDNTIIFHVALKWRIQCSIR